MTGIMDAHSIRKAQADNPKMRARDLAQQLGISEGEYVAAWLGEGTRRIAVDFNRIFPGLEACGEVMALTRNESAVHEKIGIYNKFVGGKHAAMMLGAEIDMRMFPAQWVHGFAVETKTEDGVKRSLQFFDAGGEAIHKVHARPSTNVDAWNRLIDSLAIPEGTAPSSFGKPVQAWAMDGEPAPVEELRDAWSRMTDTHQFFPLLRKLRYERIDAVRKIGDDFAWPVEPRSVETMMTLSSATELPIMCFVGNHGCIQIHSGPVRTIKEMGPWINVMDPTFHLHLRMDHIIEAWAVRKPTDKGHVTSMEAYDAAGNLIIQFFGKRIEGQDERAGWRTIMEGLPRLARAEAA